MNSDHQNAVENNDKRKLDGAVKQEFKLYIKASQIDKETRGSCPICQQWFMIAYLIAQEQEGVNFSVFTVQENNPPKEFDGWSKKFPVVLSVNCTDKKGGDMSGVMYDSFEELETFFESINRLCPELKRHNKENANALKGFESLYATFNGYLTGQPQKKLLRELEHLNEELDNGFTYLIDNAMCYVDCQLMPRLQHIKVALDRYAGFQIPTELTAIWRYLAHAYQQPAFTATMPSDQDIIVHYEKKARGFLDAVKNAKIEKTTYDTHVPEEILEGMKQNGDAGGSGDSSAGDVVGMNQQVESLEQQVDEPEQEFQQQQQEDLQDLPQQGEEQAASNNGIDYE